MADPTGLSSTKGGYPREPLPGAPLRPLKLPTSAVNGLADLVKAGFGAAQALEALPRRSLPKKVARQLEIEVRELRAGGPIDIALNHLGLEITSAAIRGAGARGAALEAALRADVASQLIATDALGKTRARIGFFAVIVASLVILTLFTSLVAVPSMIKKSTENLPADWDLPPALVHFESFRDLWFALGGGFVLLSLALVAVSAGLLGSVRWRLFLNDLRLHLPFLRSHAVHSCTARLLEALAHEQVAGIPANQTAWRIRDRESVPRLRADLELAARRLDAGDPWASCLQGTLLDIPSVTDLTALAGHGAQPTKGFHWAAAQSREEAVKGLRRAVTAIAALILIPSFLYLLVLLQVASTTAAIAQVEGINIQMEELTGEIEKILQGDQPMDSSP